MKHQKLWIVMMWMVAAALLAACGGATEKSAQEEPVRIEEAAGTEFNAVILTEKAAERLDIHSEPIHEESVDGGVQPAVPYAAIIYGLNGETWVYVRNPGAGSLRFVRAPVTVDRIEGDIVFLTDGPAPGTEVVTVGAAELYGADTGVGK